ncbi:MAG TPA: VCBS repeat-containing protein, partial [Thermoanaerobaculia bacterium]|nr:VCBS repeat-containing protein [Thermoanaerobaculia bacterium]
FGHQDLRWADVDLDGDPDLAEIHFSNGKVNLYVNHRDSGGTLETEPSWSYDSAGAGTAVAFGDLDGDGWPDLVVGNSGDPSVMVFYNRLGALFADGFESGDTSAWSSTAP